MDFGRISVGSPRKRKCPARVNPLAQSETQLKYACIEWLTLKRSFSWVQNQGQLRVKDDSRKDGFRRVIFARVKGISDIIGCLPCGCFLAAECKVKGRDLTKDQREFLERVKLANGVVVEVRDEVDSLIRAVEAHEAGCEKKRRRVP